MVYAVVYKLFSSFLSYISAQFILTNFCSFCGLGSVVGIVTGYGLDGLGIESRCRRDFLHLSRLALGSTQLPVQWVLGLSWG
jgi:hypothetical protein